jgi:hypothetical protein
MSVNAVAAVEYSHGLRKPSGDLPALTSWSLRSAMIDAKSGVEALVPETVVALPS